jgi:hypothetical protein
LGLVFGPIRVYITKCASVDLRELNWVQSLGHISAIVSPESWFKVSLSALPVAFTVFGVGAYWHEDPLRLLAPNVAFWGVVLEFYLFSNLEVPGSRAPFYFSVCSALLWLVSAITTHNLVREIASNPQAGLMFELATKDFWFAYAAATVGCGVPLYRFLKFEPLIVENRRKERA